MVTAAVVQDGLDGLITVRIISKARPCAKLTGMIEADLAPISYDLRERQPPARPHLARGDHLHHHFDSVSTRRCSVLCLNEAI